MKKTSIFLSMLVLTAMILAACGGGPTSTNVAASPPPVTADSTDDLSGMATESPVATESSVATEPGVPVTGGVNPASVANELDFPVLDQSGNQIGEVEDMVLDLDHAQVAYVAVNTSGSADLGDRTILIPWNSLQLQTAQGTGTGTGTDVATATAGTGTGGDTGVATATTDTSGGAVATATTGAGTGQDMTATPGTGTGGNVSGQHNAFILLTDVSILHGAPDFDLSTLPQMGQLAGDWDAQIRSFWESGGTGTGTGQATATAGTGTGSDVATATVDTGAGAVATATTGAGTGTDTGQAQNTATPGTDTDQGQGNQGTALQGVVLASNVLGATVTIGMHTQGQDQDLSTATPGTGTGTDQATATAGTDQGTSQENTTATINDLIVDIDTGDVRYIVISIPNHTDQWIPVPLALFQFGAGTGAFVLNADTTMLQNAPFFQNGQIPDPTTPGWNSEFDTFWQNSGAGGTGTGSGSGSGAQATATP